MNFKLVFSAFSLSLPALFAPYAMAASGTISQQMEAELSDVGVEKFTSHEYKVGVVKHIVLFKYKHGTTPEQIATIEKRFMALKDLSNRNGKRYIQRIEAGSQNSGEGADRGYQHGFIVTFHSEGDRNYYVGQPIINNPDFYDANHQNFKEFVGPFIANESGVLVFDFDTID